MFTPNERFMSSLGPKKPSSLKTTFVSSTSLNVTWNTNSYNEVYYVDYRELDSNNWNQQTVLKEQRCRINHLSPNTTYIVRVYAVIVTADDNQKVFGEAIERSFTTGKWHYFSFLIFPNLSEFFFSSISVKVNVVRLFRTHNVLVSSLTRNPHVKQVIC